MKINSNFKLFASSNFDPSKYVASPSFGVNRFMLDRLGDEKARATTIVEYRPNSKFPEHSHIGGEEFIVLEGTFKDQYGSFPAGTYVRNPIGSKHAPWVDNDGCTIMVKLLQMSEVGEHSEPIHINYDRIKEKIQQSSSSSSLSEDRMVSLDYGTILHLMHNEQTGEHVEMIWLNANESLPIDDKCQGGEELFIVQGMLTMYGEKENEDQPQQEQYKRWGWLRFPARPDNFRTSACYLKADEEGAQIFRKTGHLTEKALSMEKIQISDG